MKSGKAPFVSEDDLELTLDTMKGINKNRNQAVLLFSHFLGLRAKELAALHVGDVYDVKRERIKENIRLLGSMTKGNKYREVFLVDERAKEYIMQYLIQERPINDPNAPLFLSQKGGAFSANSMQRMISNLYKQAGIKASSHSGRRSFATRLIRKGVDIYSIQQLMGHSSINTTQVYFASDPNKLKEAVYKLSQ
ncbi:tyrosine-type recombinase/integrase [Acinetobacter brisouii]|uniref:tyrosine-type recombinase/integrase n=1 Tax=Acinetobacter brisouii TaxID=396323 RepID=UPI00124C09F6|nr:site-specific integrase [Acinetobacter brisouii]